MGGAGSRNTRQPAANSEAVPKLDPRIRVRATRRFESVRIASDFPGTGLLPGDYATRHSPLSSRPAAALPPDLRTASRLIADQARQDRRHRRARPLCDPGSAGGDLRRLGARLWTRRLAEGAIGAGQEPRSEGDCGAGRQGGGAILPRALLVRAAAGAAGGRFPGHRQHGQRHAGDAEEPGPVARHRQDRRLLHLPSARQCRDPRDRAATGRIRQLGRGLGGAHPVGPGGDQHGQ